MRILKFVRFFALVLVTFLTASHVSSQTISYSADGNLGQEPSLPAITIPAGVSTTDVFRINAVATGGANSFNSKSWQPNSTDPAGGLSYLEWSVDFLGVNTSISAMDIGFRRSGNGPQNIELQASTDGGATWTVVFSQAGLATTADLRTGVAPTPQINTSLIPPTSGVVLFRFFGSASVSKSGTLRLTETGAIPTINISLSPPSSVPVISASKDVQVISADGTSCSDLLVDAPAGPSLAAVPGSCIEYSIEIENTGAASATQFNLMDVLPANFTFVTAQRTGWDETSPTPNPFSFLTPPAAADCGVAVCNVEIENGIVTDGTSAFITVRAILK